MPAARARRPRGMTYAPSCHRCSTPVVVVATSCPWCGVAEPGTEPLSSAVIGAWLVAGCVGLSMLSVLVDALGRAIA